MRIISVTIAENYINTCGRYVFVRLFDSMTYMEINGKGDHVVKQKLSVKE